MGKLNRTIKSTLITVLFVSVGGCASIVNDPNIPLSVTFSDGSDGNCKFNNKRGSWSSAIPTTNVMIRRSDDSLIYDCETTDGRQASGSIRSEMEDGKLAASVIFFDFGITDSITDKHRTYQGNVVIPVESIEAGNLEKSASVDSGMNVEHRLKQLDSLLNQGLISKEEYRIKRQKVLSEI